MKPTEAAWLAGIFDGDGSLGIERLTYSGTRGVRSITSDGAWRLRIRLTTTHSETALRVKELIGGGYIHAFLTDYGRPAWRYDATCLRARVALEAMEPYAVTKRDRIGWALDAEYIRMTGPRVPGVGGLGSKYAPEVHEQIEELAAKIRATNQKGPRRAIKIKR